MFGVEAMDECIKQTLCDSYFIVLCHEGDNLQPITASHTLKHQAKYDLGRL